MLPTSLSKVSPNREGCSSGSALFPVREANLRMVALPCSDLANGRVLCRLSVFSRSSVIGAALPRKREVPPPHRCALHRRRRASRRHLHAESGGQNVDQKQGHERENYGLV